jgi:hypothetical protein
MVVRAIDDRIMLSYQKSVECEFDLVFHAVRATWRYSTNSPSRFLGRPLTLPNLHAILRRGTSHFHRFDIHFGNRTLLAQ